MPRRRYGHRQQQRVHRHRGEDRVPLRGQRVGVVEHLEQCQVAVNSNEYAALGRQRRTAARIASTWRSSPPWTSTSEDVREAPGAARRAAPAPRRRTRRCTGRSRPGTDRLVAQSPQRAAHRQRARRALRRSSCPPLHRRCSMQRTSTSRSLRRRPGCCWPAPVLQPPSNRAPRTSAPDRARVRHGQLGHQRSPGLLADPPVLGSVVRYAHVQWRVRPHRKNGERTGLDGAPRSSAASSSAFPSPYFDRWRRSVRLEYHDLARLHAKMHAMAQRSSATGLIATGLGQRPHRNATRETVLTATGLVRPAAGGLSPSVGRVDVALLTVAATDSVAALQVLQLRGTDPRGRPAWAARRLRDPANGWPRPYGGCCTTSAAGRLQPQQLHVFDDPGRDPRGWVMSSRTRRPSATPRWCAARPAAGPDRRAAHDAVRRRRDRRTAAADLAARYAEHPTPTGCWVRFTVRDLRRVHEASVGQRGTRTASGALSSRTWCR